MTTKPYFSSEYKPTHTMKLRVHQVRQKKLLTKARLSVNERTGVIHFNPAAVELLGLVEGQKIAFAEEIGNEGQWYLLPDGGELRVGVLVNQWKVYRVNSKPTCKDILESIGMDGAVHIPVGLPTPENEYPLLTREVTPMRKRGRRKKTAEMV